MMIAIRHLPHRLNDHQCTVMQFLKTYATALLGVRYKQPNTPIYMQKLSGRAVLLNSFVMLNRPPI